MTNLRRKIGIVGVGKMGQLHLGKLLSSSQGDLIGIHDTDMQRAREVGARYGVKVFERLGDLLFEADAAIIAVVTGAHYSVGRQALEAGVHVLIEKPLAQTVEEAAHLVKLAHERNLVLQVGLLERFRYRALTRGVRLAPVRFIECHRLSPAPGREENIDVISDLMIHDLDLVLSLIGEDPEFISAVGIEVLTSKPDLANVRMEFPGGAVVNLTASRVSSKAMRKFRVFSSEAYASLDLVSNAIDVYVRQASGAIEHHSSRKPDLDALREQSDQFLRCIEEGIPPEVTGIDGLRALRCAEIIRERILQRRSTGSQTGGFRYPNALSVKEGHLKGGSSLPPSPSPPATRVDEVF